jgi:hypothetical protein
MKAERFTYEPTKKRQVLRFQEPRSGVDVVLVGTMHYNPASIALAASTVKDLAKAHRLGALVLETCPKRTRFTCSPPKPFQVASPRRISPHLKLNCRLSGQRWLPRSSS